MIDGFAIRPACQNDSAALFPIAQDFATSFEIDKSSFTESLSGILNDPSAWLWVAEANGTLIGYLLGFNHLTLFANGRVAWVEEVTVTIPWRRKGVASALMSAFESWAQGRGSRLVALATRRAAHFYQALGYEESATYFRRLL